MSIIKIFVFLLIVLIAVVNGRTLRQRRQATTNTFGQDMNNALSYGYNTIRDNVVQPISTTVDRFSQNWDRYKQNINQGINQIGQTWDQYRQNLNQGWNQVGQTWDQYKQNLNQGWNQLRQYVNPQYPYNNNNNNNNAYNQYGYNAQQLPYPMNYNYNYPPNTYQYNGERQANQYQTNQYQANQYQPNQYQANQYPANNYYNAYGSSNGNMPYYARNMEGQRYQNVGGQQRFRRAIVTNAVVNANQRLGPRRR